MRMGAPVPRIHMDYWYLSKAEAYADDGNGGKGKNPQVVVVDADKKMMKNLAVGTQGHVAWVAQKIQKAIEDWGYHAKPVVLFSDNEPAMLALKRGVGARLDGEVQHLESPEGDSAANGVAERAVRTMEGMMRTMTSAMNERLGGRVDDEHPIWQWLALWIGTNWSRHAVGHDGWTG